MAENYRAAWADAIWDPTRGCSRKSAACVNCYAESATIQNSGPGGWGEGFASATTDGTGWSGKIALWEEHLEFPFTLAQTARIFVNSMSDLFHDDLAGDVIDRVFAVMAAAPQHQYLILTKRPKRMQEYLVDPATKGRIDQAIASLGRPGQTDPWPLPHLWLGVTAENQKEADRRIPVLLETPAAIRFIAAEPLLGKVELSPAWLKGDGAGPKIDWVLAGGEAGPQARPAQSALVRALRDQCAAAGTPFYWNDWGTTVPPDQAPANAPADQQSRYLDGILHEALPA